MTGPEKPARRPFRRFFQFRLRTLLAFMLLVGVGCGVYYEFILKPHQEQQRFLESAEEMGAFVVIESWDNSQSREWPILEDVELGMLDRIIEVDFGKGWEKLDDGKPWEPNSLGASGDIDFEELIRLIGPGILLPEQFEMASNWMAKTKIERFLARLSQVDTLETLSLGELPPFDRDLAFLDRLGRLKWLELRGATVTDAGLRRIGRLSNLTYLGLGDAKFPVQSLSRLTKLNNLQVLDLNQLPGSDHQKAQAIAELSKFDALTHLYLGRSGLKFFELRGFDSLEVIDLRFQFKSESPNSHNWTIADCPRLRVLDLTGNEVNDEVLRGLHSCPRLEKLYLNGTHVSDDGLRYLRSCKELQVLAVGGTCCTENGLRFLLHLPKLLNLEIPAEFDPAAVRKFQQTRPIVATQFY